MAVAHLLLSLLGSFHVVLDGQPITGFKSNKVRALLAYLSVEVDRPHPRETLAGLLWPEWPNRDALSNLRYSLSDLRRVISDRTADPPFLLIARDSLQFNPSSDYWLDVETFTQIVEANLDSPLNLEKLEQAVTLYRGSFLEGFSLEDSSTFDEWALLTQERLARLALSALHNLAEGYEKRGEYERAQSFAWRQLELVPWDESAHQQLMRLLAFVGQRSAALAQYESCRKLLADELGVEPSKETTTLFEQIRDNRWEAKTRISHPDQGISIAKTPAFLEKETNNIEPPVFAARTRELTKLDEHLDSALSGKGRVVFVTGEAGSGKTTLIQEFTRRAQEQHPDLLVALGNCSAYTGIGDPYLPFREILEYLTGDVESRWAAGAITREHALRLWKKVAFAAQALVEVGPDLIDTFIQRTALLERARSSVSEQQDWLIRLGAFLDRKPVTALSIGALQQVNFFEQYTKVLQSLEEQSPILLVMDDLQWADTGSINMLFHLGRRLAGCRILLLGAYRSEEVALGREGVRHPLEPLINEFRRSFADILVNLGQALGQDESREFIDEFLDKEPNRLEESFREMLYQQTQGHPLFTIELLRGLQERGDIFRDSDGCWVAGASLDWETLPARVEAAIQERISRLPKAMQKALEIASIEGELFTAEVVARVQGIDEQEILGYLSGDLDRLHRLVRAQSIQRVNSRLLSRYQFRHILFQKYLYGSLDEVWRAHMHEQVGIALEDLYGLEESATAIAVQLALHFQIARIDEKAVRYLQLASDKAMQLSAYQEVVTHATRALRLLENIPESTERDEQELALCLTLGIAFSGAKGGQLSEVRNTYDRARQLCEKLGKKYELVQVLGGLTIFYYVRAEHHKARELALEALDLAKGIGDPSLIMLCHWYLGFILFCLGEYPESLKYLKQVTDVYDHKQHHQILVQVRGSDAGIGAMAYEACCLWCLGYPDQALRRSQETLELARQLNHPFSMADIFTFAGCLFNSMRRDAEELAEEANALMQTADKGSLAGWLASGMRYCGEALVLQGKIKESTDLIQKGIAGMRTEGIAIYFSGTFATLAEKQLELGLLDDARASLDEAFAFVDETDERYWESELFRLKGELLCIDGEVSGAEACLNKAIEIARQQRAKSLELRAVMSLSRVWKEKQGKRAKAHQMLSEIYSWFTEGFDTPDLMEAKALLDHLG
jgi:DNA-binding SARP family transcriptional activator/predicted ATPase